MKFFFALLSLSYTLFAQTYNFIELRYSDAIAHYTQLEGKITFLTDGLEIEYPKTFKKLHYQNGILSYYENNDEISLNELQANKIMQYFDILMLLHKGDQNELHKMFSVQESESGKVLQPLGSLQNYIKYILVRKKHSSLQYIKIYLQNNDTISITINDKIS